MIKRNDPTSNECNGFKPGGVKNDKERTIILGKTSIEQTSC